MEHYNDLCRILENELMEITKDGSITAGNLDAIGKLLDAIKDIKKIQMMNNDGSAESYAPRSGSHYVKAHYSRKGRYDDGMRYSYADGIDHIVEQMNEMIADESISDAEKKMIKSAMDMLNH